MPLIYRYYGVIIGGRIRWLLYCTHASTSDNWTTANIAPRLITIKNWFWWPPENIMSCLLKLDTHFFQRIWALFVQAITKHISHTYIIEDGMQRGCTSKFVIAFGLLSQSNIRVCCAQKIRWIENYEITSVVERCHNKMDYKLQNSCFGQFTIDDVMRRATRLYLALCSSII